MHVDGANELYVLGTVIKSFSVLEEALGDRLLDRQGKGLASTVKVSMTSTLEDVESVAHCCLEMNPCLRNLSSIQLH